MLFSRLSATVLSSLFAAILAPALCEPAIAQTVSDPNLRVQTWARGLDHPTGVAFLDAAGTALVLEKNTGKVKVVTGRSVSGTALDLPVANESERGLLGIALAPDFAASKSVYLYYTRGKSDGGAVVDNRVERYTWTGSKLVYDKRVISLPALAGPNHNGGKIGFGPDGKLYAVIGDLHHREGTENHGGKGVTATAAVLRLNPSGSAPKTNPFYSAANTGDRAALNTVYAYGVRNSFGFDFDPLTGTMWDTENGATSYDEINRVTPGFNSGWTTVMGPIDRNPGASAEDLVQLGPRARYADPKLSWKYCVGPTDAYFMRNARLGREYQNDLFVGTTRGGEILRFDLTRTRKSLALPGAYEDAVVENTDADRLADQAAVRFGRGFGTVTDLLGGPGGMYVLSYTEGRLYRISTDPGAAREPLASLGYAGDGGLTSTSSLAAAVTVPEPTLGLTIFGIVVALRPLRRRAAVLTRPGRARPRERVGRHAP